jgi:hypothetical protein
MIADEEARPARYRDVFANPLARRLWLASSVSYIGDFAGLGALLLVAYHRSGDRPLGPAAVFAVQAIPAVAVASGIGPWLDRIARIPGLIASCLVGAASLSLPFIFGGLWPLLVTSALLGTVTTAYNSIRSGAIADGVPRVTKGPLLAAINISFQVCQVFGYVCGAGIAIAIGAGPAIAADAATFLLAGVLLAGVRMAPPSRSRQPSKMTTGIRTIFADPTLRALAPIAWIGLTMAELPTVMATAALRGGYQDWVPAAMAAAAAGTGVAGFAVGRSRLPTRVDGLLVYISAGGLTYALTAGAITLDPVLLVFGNLLIGAGLGWSVAAQTTFVLVIPPDRIANVTSVMIASLIALSGIGAIAFGAIADSLGVPAAYLIAGIVQAAGGLAGLAYGRRHPAAFDIRRDNLLPSTGDCGECRVTPTRVWVEPHSP